MTNLKEGDTPQKGPKDSPNPKTPEGSGDSLNFSEEQVRQILSSPPAKSVIEEIAEAKATSAAQSMGDKKAYQIDRKVNEVLKEYRELIEEGWSEKQAERLMNMKATPNTPEQAPESVGADKGARDLNFKSVFEAAGIDPASGTAVKLAKESGGDPAVLLSKLLETVKNGGEEELSPAGVVGDAGSPGEENPIAEIVDPTELLELAFKKPS